LEFVVDQVTGLITDPAPEALAAAFDFIWENRAEAKTWGQAGRDRYERLNLSWANVIQKLLA
jgi:glycosyltransferase involved in cell wall biosynthesis